MRTHPSLTLIVTIVGILIAIFHTSTACAQTAASLKQQAVLERQQAADYKRKSDDYSRQANATDSFPEKSRLLRASMDFFNKSQVAERMADKLDAQADALGTAPPPVVTPPATKTPTPKLRALDAAQRAKTAKVLEKLAFQKGDRLFLGSGQWIRYIGLAQSVTATEPGVDANGSICVDISFQFLMAEERYLLHSDEFLKPNARGGFDIVEPSYPGPESRESWRVFFRFEGRDVKVERVEDLGHNNPYGFRGFCGEIIEYRLKWMAVNN